MGLAFYITEKQHREAIDAVYVAIASIHQEIEEFRHWCDMLIREQKEIRHAEIHELTNRINGLKLRLDGIEPEIIEPVDHT